MIYLVIEEKAGVESHEKTIHWAGTNKDEAIAAADRIAGEIGTTYWPIHTIDVLLLEEGQGERDGKYVEILTIPPKPSEPSPYGYMGERMDTPFLKLLDPRAGSYRVAGNRVTWGWGKPDEEKQP